MFNSVVSGLKFSGLFLPNARGIALDHNVLRFTTCGSCRSLKLSEISRNFARFSPQMFFRGSSEFWDMDYKTEPTSDHVAKFRGDQPRELGDLALKIKKRKEKKTLPVKHKTVENYRFGRPKNLTKLQKLVTRNAFASYNVLATPPDQTTKS